MTHILNFNVKLEINLTLEEFLLENYEALDDEVWDMYANCMKLDYLAKKDQIKKALVGKQIIQNLQDFWKTQLVAGSEENEMIVGKAIFSLVHYYKEDLRLGDLLEPNHEWIDFIKLYNAEISAWVYQLIKANVEIEINLRNDENRTFLLDYNVKYNHSMRFLALLQNSSLGKQKGKQK